MMDIAKLKEHEIKFTKQVDPFQYILIQNDLAKRGIKDFECRPGNDCVWVSYMMIDCYYIFKDGRIIDVQYD